MDFSHKQDDSPQLITEQSHWLDGWSWLMSRNLPQRRPCLIRIEKTKGKRNAKSSMLHHFLLCVLHCLLLAELRSFRVWVPQRHVLDDNIVKQLVETFDFDNFNPWRNDVRHGGFWLGRNVIMWLWVHAVFARDPYELHGSLLSEETSSYSCCISNHVHQLHIQMPQVQRKYTSASFRDAVYQSSCSNRNLYCLRWFVFSLLS